jgi:hypothetical protein
MESVVTLLGEKLDSVHVQLWLAANGPFEMDVVGDAEEDGSARHYLQSKRSGILLRHTEDNRIETIFLMSGTREGFLPYAGNLGPGLSFSSTQDAVIRALGTPSFSRPPQEFLGQHFGANVRYDHETHSVHLEFLPDGRGLSMITLMQATTTPGRENAS